MFKNEGSKLKIFSWAVFIIGCVWSVFLAVILFVVGGTMNSIYSYSLGYPSSGGGGIFIALGVITLLLGAAVSYLAALVISGFGQIINNTNIIAAQSSGNSNTAARPAQATQSAAAPVSPAAAAPVEKEAGAADRQVKFCSQCGAENGADHAFCLKCGKPL